VALIHVGMFGATLWKLPIDAGAGGPAMLHEAPHGQTMDTPLMLSDGTIVISPSTWLGELHVLDAPDGAAF